MPRLFNLSSTFTVGSTVQVKNLLQSKQAAVLGAVNTGNYNPSNIDALNKANNPTHWPKMLGLGFGGTSCPYNSTCPGVDCTDFCRNFNCSGGIYICSSGITYLAGKGYGCACGNSKISGLCQANNVIYDCTS
jgi:hypothetical protein